MASLTITQALATTSTGITVSDTAANIASALSNAALQARVSQYTLSTGGVLTASLAAQLASLGSRINIFTVRLVLRDSVAALTDPANADALSLGIGISVLDTADHLLSIAGTQFVSQVGSVLLSTSATLTQAQLVVLEAEPGFTIMRGRTITLADSAANLMALTPAQARPEIRVFTMTVNSVVDIPTAAGLFHLPGFTIANGATLTIATTLAALNNPTSAAGLAPYATKPGVEIGVGEHLATLLANIPAITALGHTYPGLAAVMTDVQTLSAAQLTAVVALPHFKIGPTGSAILSDTDANLRALSPAIAAIATSATLSQNASVNAAQLATLAALPHFSAGGKDLVLTDGLAQLGALSTTARGRATSVIAHDTVAALLDAPSGSMGVTAVEAVLDGGTYTVDQATRLLHLAGTLTLVPAGSATSLQITDTRHNLANGATALAALRADGAVTTTSTDPTPTILDAGSVLSVAEAIAYAGSGIGLLVADTGAAITSSASQIFGRGFDSIEVTAGVLAGGASQLLDPSVRFLGNPLQTNLSPAAVLTGSNTGSVAQLTALSFLPEFSLATGASLTISDTMSALIGGAGLVALYATSVQVTNAETLTAAAATTIAVLRASMGLEHFDLTGHDVSVSDDAANIAAGANAAGIAMAGWVLLSVPSIVSAAQATALLALGSVFSPNGMALTLVDTAANLLPLAASAAWLNGWSTQVLLAADAILTVADMWTLLDFNSFAPGNHQVTLSDTAAHLLAPNALLAEDMASTITLSQPATVTAAQAGMLLALHNFSADGQMLSIADTPVQLVILPLDIATLVSNLSIVPRTEANATDFTLSADQFGILNALPISGFTGMITVSDSALALAGLTQTGFALAGHVIAQLAGNATVPVAMANTLAHLPNFSLGGHTLTVRDTPANLVAAGVAIAATVGVDAPASVSAATAATLAALPHFTANENALTIADTPVNLLALTPGVVSLAAHLQIVVPTTLNSQGFQLTAAQLTTLAALPGLAFVGPIIVTDTAAHLILLVATFAAATQGTPLWAARGVSVTILASDATVSAASLQALSHLPGFNLGGHHLIVTDTASALLGVPAMVLSMAASVSLNTATPVSASMAAALSTIGNLIGGFSISDTIGNLLAPSNAAGVAAAASVSLTADATLSVAQASALHSITGFTPSSHHLTILNGATGLVSMDAGTAAMASAILLSSNALVSVAQAQALAALPGFSANGFAITVSDTASHLLGLTGLGLTGLSLALASTTLLTAAATVTAAQAATLSALPQFSTAAGLTIADTVANLLLDGNQAGEHVANHITLTANASITVATAVSLAGLGDRLTNGGHTLIITDTPTVLLGASGLSVPLTGYALAANATPWVVAAVTATRLAALPGFSTGPGLTISDSAIALLTPTNAGGLTLAGSVLLNADAVVSPADATTLHGLAGFSPGIHALIIEGTARAIAALDAGTITMASSIRMSEDAVIAVAQLQTLEGLAHLDLNGFTLTVFDTQTHLLTLVGQNTNLASQIIMRANTWLTADQAEAVATLAHFAPSASGFTVADTVAHLLRISGGAALPDDWTGERAATAISITADATVTAAQASLLALLGDRLILNGHVLTVADSAAHLLDAGNAAGLALASSVMLAQSETGLTAAQAVKLTNITNFSKGTNSVTVADNAANLAFAGNAAGVALADHVQLSVAATLSVTAAAALIGLPNYQAGAPLAIADTLSHLSRLGSTTLSFNNNVLQSTAIVLSEDATATAAQLIALIALPEYGHFSRNGFALTLLDSGRHLANYTPSGAATPTAIIMAGDATLTASQATELAAMHVDLDGNSLTIADTPTALLSTAGLALASMLVLSTNATATAAQATALFADTRFNTSGHILTIQDSTAALLDLSSSIVTLTGTMALIASETINAATLLGVTQLGSRFSLNGHTMTVADSAANLAGLNTLETHLTTSQVLNASAVVTAAVAEALASLAHVTLGTDVSLTIADTVSNLIGLSSAARGIATAETLLAGAPLTMTVAQAQALGSLHGFHNTGASITVVDSLTHLNTTGWQSVADAYGVIDSIANLLDFAASPLVAHAASVVLAGDAVTDTTTITTLAAIPHFSHGGATLIVADAPDAIAAHANEILAIATSARVISSTAITAAQAETLVGLANAGALTFAGSNHLAISDTFSHLSDAANADGLALATTVTVTDTAPHLVAAAGYNWGSVTPFYVLTDSSTVTGEQATVLAGLGGHFSKAAFTLTLADNAANTLTNAADLAGLAIFATVSDSIANLAAHAADLATLGARLLTVTPTDTDPVIAALAAGLHPLVSVLTGTPIAVADTAADIVAVRTDLLGLGAHLGTVTLTDATPITAATASGLLPLVTHLANSAVENVTDTAAALIVHRSDLAALGTHLGTITLSDGTATDAATAAGLEPLAEHLGHSETLTVTDTATAIADATTGLLGMAHIGHITSIAVPHATVADIVAHGTTLAALHATAQLVDTAAHVNTGLNTLQGFITVVTSITLTDAGTPTLSIMINQLGVDDNALTSINTPYHLTVSDTAAAISADLADPHSLILAHLAGLTGISVSDNGTVQLTVAQILAAHIDDGSGSVMALLSGGSIIVHDASVTDVIAIADRPVPPTSIMVTDTAANVQADLSSGASGLVANRSLIGTITISGGAITLTDAQAQAAHVDDGPGSVFAKLSGGTLTVTGVSVAQLDTIAGMPVAPSDIAVSDSAAHVQADLVNGASRILAYAGVIAGITVNDAGTITLTPTQIETAHIDDGATSALAKITGAALAVTGAQVSDLATLAGLTVVPATISIIDTPAHVQADLASGHSSILASLGRLSGIALSPAGTITLTQAQALATGVDDGVASALALISGVTLSVSGVDIADIGTVLGLGVAPSSISVSDTQAHIQANLLSGTSTLVAHRASISGISVADHGTISLNVATITASGVDDGAGSVLAKTAGGTVTVTGAAVADLATLLALGVAPSLISIVDTAAHVADDLNGVASLILAHSGVISTIMLTDAGTPALHLSLAQLGDAGAGLALIGTPYTIAISDTAAHIQADLMSGVPALLAHRSALSAVAVSDAGTIMLTQSQILASHVDDGAGSIFGLLSGGSLVVTHVAIASLATVFALTFAPSSVSVVDTAAHLQADLTTGTPATLAYLGSITTIAITGTISLTSAQIQAASVDDFAGSALAKMTGGTLAAIDVPVADIPTLLALGVPPVSLAITDTAAHIQADLTSGASVLLANRAVLAGIVVSDHGVISLTVSQAETAHVDSGANALFGMMTGETLSVTGALVSDIGPLAALTVAPTGLAISDTAAHIQADLTSGASHLAVNLGLISAISVSDAGTITLTAAQALAVHVDDGAASVLGLTSGGILAVTHAAVADLAPLAALTVTPASIAMIDTASHIQADLASVHPAILASLASITAITLTPAGTVTLTQAQMLAAHVEGALTLMAGLTLHVSDVAVADIATILALGIPPSSITISDTAAHIETDLTGGSSAILAKLSVIGGIAVSDAGIIHLTVAQVEAASIDDGDGSVFARLTGGTLHVTDAVIADLDTLGALGVPPSGITVGDTAAHVQSDLASGSSHIVAHNGLIITIAVTDAGTISLTESALRAAHVDDGTGSVLAKTTGLILAATHVLAADVGLVLGLGVPPTSVAVTDTAANVRADLISGASELLAHASVLAGITISPSGGITLTATQALVSGIADGAASVLAVATGTSLTVTDVSITQLDTIAGLFVTPSDILVIDTPAHIQADLAVSGSSVLLAHLGLLSSVTSSPAGGITLTEQQVQQAGINDSAGSVLGLTTDISLTVSGVPVADIATIMAMTVAPAHITVVDSAANITADLVAAIGANASVITSVTPTDSTLSVTDATALYNALLGVAPLVETGLTITGSAADLLTAHGTVAEMLSAAALVTMTDNPASLTAAQASTLSSILGAVLGNGQTLDIQDTAAHLLDSANSSGIALATNVRLSAGIQSSAADVTALVHLHSFTGGQTIIVQDSVAALLNAANADGVAAANSILLQSDSTVTGAQLVGLANIVSFDRNSHALVVGDSVANILALTQPTLDMATLVRVTDTAAHVSSALNSLQSGITAHAHPLAVVLSDGVANIVSITVTASTYSAYTATIDAITARGVVRVIGTAAQLAALSSTLAADAVVGEIAVSDSAANILSNLTALNNLGAKFVTASITDAALSASLVSGLLTIPHLNATNIVVADTGAQIAAAVQSGGASGLAFLNSHTVRLSGNSVVTASQALSLESLTTLDKNGFTLSAWDTASHLIDSVDGYLAAVSASLIDRVYLKTAGGTATVSAATVAALFSIPNFSKNNPTGSANVLTVQDTAARLESSFTGLNAHRAAVDNIVISASTTVTDAVYGHLLTLAATGAFGTSLTVRDTAANIFTSAPTQLSGSPSLTPATWALSGSATITAAGAAFLGGLSGFSAGAFTLTIGADASVTVANANALGSLGSTLRLGLRHLHVAGSVATVSGLSTAAKIIVSPDITDTFANIAGLTIGSGLLGGTITLTNSGSPTVAQVNAFLVLLTTGGISAANVSFNGHIEAVTDTLANITTITSAAGWTGNASVHAAFTLTVADTVAHLIDAANTTALAGMAGTTLMSDQTTTAANAQALVALENTIHFTLGGHTVTIQDTAAHILDAANADGEASATAWLLSGNNTVTAVDAETLLSAAKFSVNSHTLTIADSSDNLLDGVLSGAISGFSGAANVHVQLATAETLDALTAAALVALPGFTNNGDLSIQDSSDYLLNAANHAAEVAATSVILLGDETVSVATATHLASVPHFALGSAHLTLASNDYVDAAALAAIGDFDTGFDANGHTLTLTQDALSLTPDEYTALQSDNIVLNGHAMSALPTGLGATSSGGSVFLTAHGIDGATLNVYAASGSLLVQTTGAPASFTVTAAEADFGNALVVTQTVGASAANSESAPLIALEQTVLTGAATSAGATFATSGSVQIGIGAYADLYTSANAPSAPTHPVLVYDATAHTLSLDIAGHSPLVLVTLGGATHPAALDPTEIIVQHFG